MCIYQQKKRAEKILFVSGLKLYIHILNIYLFIFLKKLVDILVMASRQ